MNAVEEQVPDVIETVLSFLCPGEGGGLTVFAASELRERADDVRIIRYESCRLHEYAERFSQFGYVRGGDHTAYGVEIFVGKTGTVFFDQKTEKGARGEADRGFGGVKRSVFPFTQGEEIGVALEQVREGVRALRVIVDVRSGTEVSFIGEGPKYSGGGGTGNGARVHLAKHHPCGLYETERSVNG